MPWNCIWCDTIQNTIDYCSNCNNSRPMKWKCCKCKTENKSTNIQCVECNLQRIKICDLCTFQFENAINCPMCNGQINEQKHLLESKEKIVEKFLIEPKTITHFINDKNSLKLVNNIIINFVDSPDCVNLIISYTYYGITTCLYGIIDYNIHLNSLQNELNLQLHPYQSKNMIETLQSIKFPEKLNKDDVYMELSSKYKTLEYSYFNYVWDTIYTKVEIPCCILKYKEFTYA